MITFTPSYTGKTSFLSYPDCLDLWWKSMTGVQIECVGCLWRPVLCLRAVRFKMFLPLTSVKNKLCTSPPDSLSWKRGFTLIFLPLLIDKQRIYNPRFKSRCCNWKECKFPPSPTSGVGYTVTTVSHSGWAYASHQAVWIHRLKKLSHPLSSPAPSKPMPEENTESRSFPSATLQSKDRRARGVPYFHYLACTQPQWWENFLVAWARLKTSTCLASTQYILALMSTHAFFIFFFCNENVSPAQTTFAQLPRIFLYLMPTLPQLAEQAHHQPE